MQHNIPVKEGPKLTILEYPGWLEYRVQPPQASGGLRRLMVDVALVLAVAYFCNAIISRPHCAGLVAILALFYIYSCLTRVLWESVVVMPSLGIQLETHKGFFGVSLFTSRRFIPWSSLEDFLINEGLRGWDIRYYLVAIHRTQQGALKLEVAFEAILPRFPILLEVYRGVQEALRNENGDKDEDRE